MAGGVTAVRRPDGKLSDIHDPARGLDIHRGLNGHRVVVADRPGGMRVVSERGRPGFVQRPFAYRGGFYAHRTYVYHGRVYDRFYRSYSYHGVAIDVYAPRYYYGSGFYGWAYNPWYHPVAYAWGWGASPWVGYYGSYFTPYPVYSSAPLWLTDYMISSDLQAEYQANQEAGNVPPAADALGTMWNEREGGWAGTWTRRGSSDTFDANWGSVTAVLSISTRGPEVLVQRRDSSDGNNCDYHGTLAPDRVHVAGTYDCSNGGRGVPWQAAIEGNVPTAQAATGGTELTPDVKQAISNEVANQIAVENAAAQQNAQGQDVTQGSSGIAGTLADGKSHVFVVGSDLDLVDATGAECAVSSGDVLNLATPPGPTDTAASLTVLASKGGQECPKSATVTVALNDLQEMQNQMRSTIDEGLAKLQAQQGTNGLPPAPPSAKTSPTDAGFAANAPPADQTAAAAIAEQDAQANTAENTALAGSSQ